MNEDKKKILIVDDNYETVNYLRSALELARNTYTVSGVPSGEEAWLELLSGDIDLVIIDLRLPGMSGSELMERVHQRFPTLPTIVMSGYSLEWMKRETAELTVFRLLEKPLDTTQLLDVVDTAIFGEPQQAPAAAVSAPALAEVDVSDRLRRRLEQLRQETGARRLLLGTLRGNLVYVIGERLPEFDEETLTGLMGRNLRDSLSLAEAMSSEEALTVQVQTSRRFEVYMANLGHHYFVTLFYPAQSQRARIGTIWVFLQRALRDLIPLLPSIGETEGTISPPPGAAADSALSQPVPQTAPVPTAEPEPEPEVETAAAGPPLSLEEALTQGLVPAGLVDALQAVEVEPSPAVEESEAEDLFGDIQEETAEDLSDILALTAEHEADPAEAEAFWKGIITGDTEGEADDERIDEALQTGILISERLEGRGEGDGLEEAQAENQLEDGEGSGGGGGATGPESPTFSALDARDETQADVFWETALHESDVQKGRGIDFAEARQRGLFPEEKPDD